MDDVSQYKILNSIIIPVFGNEKLLLNLIETLMPTIDDRCEVIVVDDGLENMKINQANLPTEAKYISNSENCGYSETVNRGIKNAIGYYITTINSDILLDQNWLINTRKTFENFDNIGFVGAKLIYPTDGRIQCSGIRHYKKIIVSMYKMKNNNETPNEIYKVSTTSDALATMPLHVLKEVGFYDCQYFNAYDDVDLCLKIGKAGYDVICNPLIIGYHHTASSKEFRYAKESEGAKLFFSKWEHDLNDNLIHCYDLALSEFQSKGYSIPQNVFIVNACCRTNKDIIEVFENISKVTVLQKYDFSQELKDTPKYEQKIDIDLLKLLPYSMLTISLPIIYIVDSFIQLKNNYYWALKRKNQSDIVFDSNFNIYMLNEIID